MFRSICLVVMVLVGCSGKEKPTSEVGKPRVLSTVAMINDLVHRIGQDEIVTTTLIQGDLDPHTYELVKGDDEKFARASLIFYNGLGLEHGLSLRKWLEQEKRAVDLGATLLKKVPSKILKTEGQFDPHVWMDISLWAEVVEPIVAALSDLDPAHAELFHERGSQLYRELVEADRVAFERLQQIPEEKRYLVTTHNAFHYFSKRYLATKEEQEGEQWRKRVAAPEGLAPEAEISLVDIKEMVAHIEKYKISVLFPESNLNRDALNKIVSVAHQRGWPLRLSSGPVYGDALGKESYLKMMEHNVEIIVGEWGKDVR